MIETALQDVRYGFRMLRRSPGFSVLAIFCLTLGIGANAAVFSWIEGTLLRPFPGVADQGRLLILAGTNRGEQGYSDVSWPDFLDFRRNCTRVEVIAEKITGSTLSIGDRAERAPGSIVSANYFQAMGVRPVLGRAFTLLGIFGGLAVLLAAIGLYGVMSYAVSQSRRELGLRMALGASATHLLRRVMSQGMALTAGGVILGVTVALGTTRLLGYLLYKVSPRDPLAFGSAFLVMLIAALAACFFPAWRATRTDPVRALRE
jgi:hypothetical protein